MALKKYYKNQYTGNENGWHEPIITLGETSLSEQHLNELNSQFRNTGIKYEDKQYTKQYLETTINQADHGEPNLAVKDGKLKPTKTKAADKMKETKKEAKHKGQQPAKPSADDAFVKSDGEVKHAEIDAPKVPVKKEVVKVEKPKATEKPKKAADKPKVDTKKAEHVDNTTQK